MAQGCAAGSPCDVPGAERDLEPAPEGGWRITGKYQLEIQTPPPPPNGIPACSEYAIYQYKLFVIFPDGSKREFLPSPPSTPIQGWDDGTTNTRYFRVHPNPNAIYNGCGLPALNPALPATLSYLSADGSYMRLDITTGDYGSGGINNNPWTLYMKDGTKVEGGLNPNLGGNQRIYDRNDNYITIANSIGASPWTTLQDQMGRVAQVGYNFGTWTAVQLGTSGTGLATYVATGMVWPSETYSCSSFGTCQYGSGQVVFQSITFPDQVDKKLVFDYSLAGSTNIPLGWGELKRVTVQDKYGSELASKTYTYRWSHGQLPNWENVLMNAPVTATLAYKEFSDTGTSTDVTENWAYANAGTGSGTVTAPDGSTVVYTGFPIQYSVSFRQACVRDESSVQLA
ncbi:MAG: hypothetical protein IT165_10895 [Bryobacterales bacterium]|nr:hypothetical protein [Bryobacterales bacterium]